MKQETLPLNVFILLILAFIWGSSYILMKRGLDSFSAIQVSMLRILFAFVVLMPFLPNAIRKIQKKDLRYLMLVAVLGSGVPSYLYPLAITKVDSSVAGIINTLTPLFTMLFGWAFFQFKPTIYKVLGIIIALIGAGVLVLRAKDASIQIDGFALVAVLATVCYGLSSNILKSKLNHVQSAQLTSLTFAIIGPVAFIILCYTDFFTVMQTNPLAWKSLGYIGILGVIGTALALVLFNYLIKRTDALYASSVTFLMPVVAMFWGFMVKEAIGASHLIGFVLVLLGVFLTNRVKMSIK